VLHFSEAFDETLWYQTLVWVQLVGCRQDLVHREGSRLGLQLSATVSPEWFSDDRWLRGQGHVISPRGSVWNRVELGRQQLIE